MSRWGSRGYEKAPVVVLVCAALLSLVGCATNTEIHFAGPAKATLYLVDDGTRYVLPAVLALPQRDNPIELFKDSGGRPIRLVTADNARLRGFLYVYKQDFDQTELLAHNVFDLTDEQLEQLKGGSSVKVTGTSARSRPVYKVVLGLESK